MQRCRVCATFLGLVLFAAAGCAREIDIAVNHPAQLDLVPLGNTISIGAVVPNGHAAAAADVAAELERQISSSRGAAVRVVPSGGAATIDGAIVMDAYGQKAEMNEQRCTRLAQSSALTSLTPREESFDCSSWLVVGEGKVRIHLRVSEAAGEGRVLFERDYEIADRLFNPRPGDPALLMHRLRRVAVTSFTRALVPWRATVRERFETCEGDGRCDRGCGLAAEGDLAGAEILFSEVIGPYDRARVPPGEAERIGDALYDRGITRAHLGRYADALADLRRAVELEPAKTRLRGAAPRVEQMAREDALARARPATP